MLEADVSNFATCVLEASDTRTIVVDFWSANCAPCRVLGPILKSLEEEHAGAWTLVTVDVEASPQIADDFGVASIPAVKAFRGGRVIDAFVGAWPRESIERWLTAVLPSEAEGLIHEATAAERRGDLDRAAKLFASVDTPEGRCGLARVLALRGDFSAAAQMLAEIPRDVWPTLRGEVEQVAIRVQAHASASHPELGEPLRVAASGELELALESVFALLDSDVEAVEGQAARLAVTMIGALGQEDPRASRWRERLARVLY